MIRVLVLYSPSNFPYIFNYSIQIIQSIVDRHYSMRTIIAASSIILLFAACDNAQLSNGSNELKGIPFLAGTENMYEWSVEADTGGLSYYSSRDSIRINVISNKEQLFGYTNLTLMEITSMGDQTRQSRVWYLHSPDSLTEVAYSGAGRVPVVMPKGEKVKQEFSPMAMPYIVRQLITHRILQQMDSITQRMDNRIVYRFPMKANDEWISFRYPFLQKRRVVGTEFAEVKAGRFFCTKIKTDIYFSNVPDTLLVWYDYVAPSGLILRTLTYQGMITTEENPDGLTWAHSVERSELIGNK